MTSGAKGRQVSKEGKEYVLRDVPRHEDLEAQIPYSICLPIEEVV